MRSIIVRTLALAATTTLLAGCAATQDWIRVSGYDQPCPADYPRFLYTEWVSSGEQNTICGK